jgi:hypothetical protein
MTTTNISIVVIFDYNRKPHLITHDQGYHWFEFTWHSPVTGDLLWPTFSFHFSGLSLGLRNKKHILAPIRWWIYPFSLSNVSQFWERRTISRIWSTNFNGESQYFENLQSPHTQNLNSSIMMSSLTWTVGATSQDHGIVFPVRLMSKQLSFHFRQNPHFILQPKCWERLSFKA